MPKIHAAANRIPVLRTNTTLKNYPELNDREPASLDHFPAHTWSGSIRFSITAKTPLVYGNVDEDTGAISVPTTTIKDKGKATRTVPILPATMVKGMLSNAYERVTSSRLRVFGDYSEPLTYRMDPAECQKLVPTLVRPNKREAVLLTGTHDRLPAVKKSNNSQPIPVMMAATLRTRQGSNTKFAPRMNNKRLLALIRPAQGKRYRRVEFDAKLVDNGIYAYWFIYALYTNTEPQERVPLFDENILTGEDLNETLIKQGGYVYITTDPDDLEKNASTFDKKMAERVFFIERGGPNKTASIPEGTDSHPSPIEKYFQVLESYSQNWDSETGSTPNIYIRQYEEILTNKTDSFFAYSLLSENSIGKKVVDTLVPISVGRNAYTMSPLAVARRARIAPAEHFLELSPADRLFGYVAHIDKTTSNPDRSKEPTSSFRGRISVTDVRYSDGEGQGVSSLRLRPLLNPRPSSARRFLTRIDGSNINSFGKKVKRSQYFSTEPEQALGATTYPIDRNAWELIDKETGFPKKALKTQSDTDKVTSKVKSYVKAGTKFEATIHFEALTHFELSCLLWILDSSHLVPQTRRQQHMSRTSSDRVGYLRLGMGKPLGLGVVQVDLSPNGFHACKTNNDGSDATSSLCASYAQLTGCLGTVTSRTDPSEFQVPIEYLTTPWVESFQRSCFGYSDKLEVRHLNLEENKVNNKTDWRTGLPLDGSGIEPGPLWGPTSGQPIHLPDPHKK